MEEIEREALLAPDKNEGIRNPLNANDHGVELPEIRARGNDAFVPQLAIEATTEDEDRAWRFFATLLKITFTMGFTPTLWQTEKDEMNKSVRARKQLTDLFSMPNVAIACHYW